jgi:hypothetical protein
LAEVVSFRTPILGIKFANMFFISHRIRGFVWVNMGFLVMPSLEEFKDLFLRWKVK